MDLIELLIIFAIVGIAGLFIFAVCIGGGSSGGVDDFIDEEFYSNSSSLDDEE